MANKEYYNHIALLPSAHGQNLQPEVVVFDFGEVIFQDLWQAGQDQHSAQTAEISLRICGIMCQIIAFYG
jgi:hypothetical protein